MPFSELTGQDRAVGALRAALRRGALHHAYLFGGPPGAGKRDAARLLAQAANCEQDGDDPCGACAACRKIAKGLHPDVYVLETERAMVKAGRWEPRGGRTPSKDVVVDQVRDLVEHRLSMKRYEGRRRVIVIDPADAMNVQAQNALLKTLEEPPEGTTLILVADNGDALLPTIRSRCARIAFAPRGDGGVGELVTRARKRVKDAEDRSVVSAAAALDPSNAATWIAFAATFGDEREAARARCELLLLWFRDVLAVQAAGEGARLALPDRAEETRRVAAAISPAEALRRRERVAEARDALKQNAGAALALERMCIGWFQHG